MSDAAQTAMPAAAARPAERPVILSDIDVPFGRLVVFFVKAGLAAIPALIIVMLTVGVIGALMRGLFRIGWWGMLGGPYWW